MYLKDIIRGEFDMKEVNIYIRTSLTGPCIKDGRWAAAMECQTSKGPAVKGICGEE